MGEGFQLAVVGTTLTAGSFVIGLLVTCVQLRSPLETSEAFTGPEYITSDQHGQSAKITPLPLQIASVVPG